MHFWRGSDIVLCRVLSLNWWKINKLVREISFIEI